MIVKEYMAVCDFCGESSPDWKQDLIDKVKTKMKSDGWKRVKG